MPGLASAMSLSLATKVCIAISLGMLYSQLVQITCRKKVTEVITNAVAIEKEFVSDALPVRLIGIYELQI
jgi:hypothetical protein